MVSETRVSQSSHSLIVGIAVTTLILAGFSLTPVDISGPVEEASLVADAFRETLKTEEQLDDHFREYTLKDGELILTRLLIDLRSSSFVPQPGDLKHLRELTLSSPSVSELSHWFEQIDSSLRQLKQLSIRIRSEGGYETPHLTKLLPDVLADFSRTAPAVETLKLHAPKGCPAPVIGDYFRQLNHLTVDGFDCRVRVRTMIGRAALVSLAIMDETRPQHRFGDPSILALTADDLRAIQSLYHLKQLRLIDCLHSTTALNNALRDMELNELVLCCEDVESLSSFESIETLRIGYSTIHRSTLEDISRFTNLRNLEFHECDLDDWGDLNQRALQPPPSLRQFTVKNTRPYSAVLGLVENSILDDVEVTVEEFYPLDAVQLSKLGNAHHLKVFCEWGQGREFVEAVTKLDRLQSLTCSVNEESLDVLPQLLAMKTLRKLDLRFAFRHRIDDATWENTLQQIAAERPNHLEEISLRNYGDSRSVEMSCRLLSLFPALRTVTLDIYGLNEEALRNLERCQQLRLLNFEECEFEGDIQEALTSLSHLENLNLGFSWYPKKKPRTKNHWLRLRQLQLHLADESPLDLKRISADRFLIDNRVASERSFYEWWPGEESE